MKVNILLNFLAILFLVQPDLALAQRLNEGPQVLTFHSQADDTDQPYAIYIPDNFDESKAYPLVIMLHGAGSNHRLALKRVFGKTNLGDETDVEASRYFQDWDNVDYIVAAPFARGTAGYQGIPEQDVYAVLEDVKNRFRINENKVYLTGLSMGGGGTLWLGLSKPDTWAAIAPVCPAPPIGTMDLALNAQHLPIHFFHGDADPVVPISGTREWVDQLQKLGAQVYLEEYEGVAHDSWVNAYRGGRIFEWLSQFERNPHPDKIQHVSRQLKYGKAYWVSFKEIIPGGLGQLKVSFSGEGKLTAESMGLKAFEIDLTTHPLKSEKMTLVIDSVELSFSADKPVLFTKNDAGVWETESGKNSVLVKKSGQEGPVFDAFSSRHVYVYGTADAPDEKTLQRRKKIAEEAAYWSRYRGEFLGRIHFFPRVLADHQVRKSDREEAHLVLFGNSTNNLIIKEMKSDLPFSLNEGIEKKGLLYIFPKASGYVVINEGVPWWEIDQAHGYRFLSHVHQNLSRFKDFQVYDSEYGVIMAEGYFDQNWGLSPEDVEKLKSLNILDF